MTTPDYRRGPRTEPPGVTSRARTRVLLALVQLYEHHKPRSIDSVAEAAGMTRSTTYAHLSRLQEAGLVAGLHVARGGALHPTVQVVAHTPDGHRPRLTGEVGRGR